MSNERGRPGARVAGVLRDSFRLLTFRSSRAELLALGRSHLFVGLLATWLVGMGRYWHAPNASWLQRAGIASLIYLCALSLLLWLLYLPLRPNAWSFRRTLTFVSLVSPPAALQAIPIEQCVDDYSDARLLGAAILGVVTTWRAGLLLWFLVRSAGLRPLEAVISILLPLDLIVVALGIFEVRHPIDKFVNQELSLDLLSLLAYLFLPLPLLGYVAVAVYRFVSRWRKSGWSVP